MAVPIAARDVAAVVGALLVLTAAVSVVGTLIVPRSVSGWLTRWVGVIVDGGFRTHLQPRSRVYGQRDPDPGRRSGDVPAQPTGGLAAHLLRRVHAAGVAVHVRRRDPSTVTLAGPAVLGPNDAFGAQEAVHR